MKCLGFFKKVIIVLMVVSMLVGKCNVEALAADEEYKSFSQLDSRWSSYVYGGGETIGRAGCAITGISVLMAYANPELRDVNKWNPKEAAKKFSFQGAGIYWGSVKNADSTFTLLNGGKAYDGAKLSEADAKAKVKGYLDKGYYVLICCVGLYTSGTTHYSPVVGWENDKPLVWDVAGGKHSNWDTWAKQGITQMIVYESSKNSSKDTLGKTSGDALAGTPKTEEEKKRIDGLIDENGLTGMPKDVMIGAEVCFPGEDSLSDEESNARDNIKDAIKERKLSVYSVLSTIVMFIGLSVIVYGFLLGVAYLFDRTNNLAEISLIAIITLGRYRVWDENYGVKPGFYEPEKIFYCNSTLLIKRLIIIELVGFFLVSGLWRIF